MSIHLQSLKNILPFSTWYPPCTIGCNWLGNLSQLRIHSTRSTWLSCFHKKQLLAICSLQLVLMHCQEWSISKYQYSPHCVGRIQWILKTFPILLLELVWSSEVCFFPVWMLEWSLKNSPMFRRKSRKVHFQTQSEDVLNLKKIILTDLLSFADSFFLNKRKDYFRPAHTPLKNALLLILLCQHKFCAGVVY